MIRIFLNDRRIATLTQLINRNDMLSINQLACQFKVSERTVRYDLAAIGQFLAEKDLPSLVHKRNGHVRIAEHCQSVKLVSLLKDMNVSLHECALSTNQRKYLIINELLNRNSYITINQLAAKMYFSRNTVIKDIVEVKEWLTGHKVRLKSVPKHGLRVDGEEKYIRKALFKLLREAFSFEQYLELLNGNLSPDKSSTYPFVFYNQILRDLDVELLRKGIRNVEKKLAIVFADIYFVDLVLCLAITVQRLRMSRNIIVSKEAAGEIVQTQTFGVIREVAEEMQPSLDVEFSIDELVSFTQHVFGCTLTANSHSEKQANRMESHVLISNLIAGVSRDIDQDLSANQILFDCLYQEIVPAIHRLKQGLAARNPYLADIKENYGFLFAIIKKNLRTVEEYCGSQFSEAEIGYLTLDFGAALEKIRGNRPLPKLLVVCGTGMGTANLLAAKIEVQFNVDIIATAALHEVDNLVETHNVNLIVSTIPLARSVPSICVSPLLGAGDIAVLRQFITEWNERLNKRDNSVRAVLPRQGKQLISPPEQEPRSPRLAEVIARQLIKVDVTVRDWREAIACAGALLKDNGYIEFSYIQAMIDMVRKHGPYIVFWQGIALPHADATASVNRLGISCVRMATPVAFGNADHDPVDMVFAFATPNEYCHITALMELSNVLSDRDIVAKLRAASSSTEIHDIIGAYA